MPSRLIRLLFSLTSLAPVLLIYALKFFVEDEGSTWELNRNNIYAALFLLGAVILAGACWASMSFFFRRLEDAEQIKMKSLKPADQQVVAFVVAYILPLATPTESAAQWIMVASVFLLLTWLIYHSSAYLTNPLLSTVGYRFYEFTDQEEVSCILISRREILSTRLPVRAQQISGFMFFDAEG